MLLQIRGPFFQVATGAAPAAGVGDINAPAAREAAMDWPAQGQDMPEQGGGGPRTILLPDVYNFRIPQNVAQLWHELTLEDKRPWLPTGQPNPTKGQQVRRWQLKFDKSSPLVVVGGPHDGEPMLATFSTQPRPRSMKKDAANDPATPWVSDLAFLLDICLQDHSRPVDPNVFKQRVNLGAGKVIRLRTGLSAQCRPDKVRYIRVAVVDPNTRQQVEQDMQDPTGAKGCGQRYYTKDFKDPRAGQPNPQVPGTVYPKYNTEIACDNGACTQSQHPVVLRAFESVEEFLAPLGA